MVDVVYLIFNRFLTYNPPQQAIYPAPLSWAFCENCLNVFCEFFHSMITVRDKWAPLIFKGRS